MGDERSSEFTGERSRPRWKNPVSWSVLLAIGWLVYEVTAQPALGAAVTCAKFGWNDFWTACWLRRTDPDKNRGTACFWLYLASGLCKVATPAVLVVWILIVLEPKRVFQPPQQPGNKARQLFIETSITACAGFGLSAVAAYAGLFIATRHRIKVWVHPAVHGARKAGVWPPTRRFSGRHNLLCLPLGTTLAFTMLLLIMLGAPLIFSRVFDLDRIQSPLVGMIVVFGYLAIAFTPLYWVDAIYPGVNAHSPFECWRNEECGESESIHRIEAADSKPHATNP